MKMNAFEAIGKPWACQTNQMREFLGGKVFQPIRNFHFIK
jgi:hypothetical protein